MRSSSEISRASLQDVAFYIHFYNQDWQLSSHFTTEGDGPAFDLHPGKGVVKFTCKELGLKPGVYFIYGVMKKREADRGVEIACLPHHVTILVEAGKATPGAFYTPHTWKVERDSQNN